MTMTTFHFQTHVSDSGVITLPLDAKDFYGEIVSVNVGIDAKSKREVTPDPARILPKGKTALDDFLDFCKELNLPPMTDEEVDQIRFDALMEKYG
jgi:predicted HicB family RNase H-like nuclease